MCVCGCVCGGGGGGGGRVAGWVGEAYARVDARDAADLLSQDDAEVLV